MMWFEETIPKPNQQALDAAKTHQQNLTKPPGSLGQLERVAEKFAAWQNTAHPELDRIAIRVFAADHGICAQGVSAFPQEVTVQMIANFCSGGAAISVLAEDMGADFSVINMGVAHPLLTEEGVVNVQLAAGTKDFSREPAMSKELMLAAIEAGREQAPDDAQLCIGGEMGIGNTTSASALYCALLNLSAEETVGPGTGIDAHSQNRKQAVVDKALNRHVEATQTPLGALATLGGLEIAALVGFYIGAAQKGIPSVVDGFISTAAALVACRVNPALRDWLIFGHESAEPAHRAALYALDAKPLVNIGMRLGEGSGAAVAVSLIRSALVLHNNMATFKQAGVSNAD